MENMTGGIKLEFWFAFLSLRCLDVFTGISLFTGIRLLRNWKTHRMRVSIWELYYFSRTNQGSLE